MIDLSSVALKGGNVGGIGFAPILQLIPFVMVAMFLLITYSIIEGMLGGSGIKWRFWKKKKH